MASSILLVPKISPVSGSIGQFISILRNTVLLSRSKSSNVRTFTPFLLCTWLKSLSRSKLFVKNYLFDMSYFFEGYVLIKIKRCIVEV